MSATKKCPMCAEQIPLATEKCEYCGAQFEVTSRGYCQNCHQVRDVDENGHCKVCGNAVVDIRVEGKLLEEPTQKPITKSVPIAQPESGKSGTKKTAAIIGTIVISLLCGFPGVFSMILGLVSLFGTVSPDVPPEILTETLEQNQISRQELFNYSLIFIGVGILLILIPIVFGILTLRNKRTVAQSPKKSLGSVLAQIVAACLILVGAGFLLVKVAMPRLNRVSILPDATSAPVEVNIPALNAQSPAGQSYENAQQIADLIVDNGINCTYKSANIEDVPIYDMGECWFAEDDRWELGNNATIWIERIEEYALGRAANDGITLSPTDITQLIQKSRTGYWDAYRDTIKTTSEPDWQKILVGPKWQITGKVTILVKIQAIIGGDILDFLSETDRAFYITR
jgi:hypothetical protein